MATITKFHLSNSTNGRPILVAASTSGSATQVHTASASGFLDEVYLYAHNGGANSLTMSLNVGGQSEPQDLVRVVLNPYQGRYLMLDGKLVSSSSVIYAYASLANSASVDGFVNRISV